MNVLAADAGARRRARAPPAAARAGAARRRGRASARSSCSPPTSSSSRRPAAPKKSARAHASGDEVRTVIAGYHWFTDWGRDTMISLEGLTLVTGRHVEAGLHPADLRALRARRPDPEHVSRGREGRALSHRRRDAVVLPRRRTATSQYTGRSLTLSAAAIRRSRTSSTRHVAGTRFGIHVDPARRPADAGRARAIS